MISPIRRLWEALSPQHTHRDIGLKILDRLLELKFSSLPTSTVSFNVNPSPAHIFRDVHAQHKPKYRNQLLDFDGQGAGFCDFVAGWVTLAHDPGADVTHLAQIPYSVTDVPASDRGLGACGVHLPEYLKEADVVVRPLDFGKCDGNLRITTTITPAGSIADPHIDGSGSGLFLFQLFGMKLVFAWPASPHNLKWMETYHGIRGGPNYLPQAMEELSQMHVTALVGHQSTVLEPGMIHAVMSPNNSAIAGWDFVKAAWLAKDDVQRQMLWEATLVKAQRKNPSSHLYDLQTYLDDDLKLWELLGTKLDEDRRTRIGAMVNLIRAAK